MPEGAVNNPEQKSKSSSNPKEVKKAISKHTESLAMDLAKKISLDSKTGERIRSSIEDFAVDFREFSLSFMPEATQTHVINMNREALLTVQSLINNSLNLLDKERKR